MPMLIIQAVIAGVSLLTPRHATESIRRILTNIALVQANARWITMAAGAQEESSYGRSRADALAQVDRAIP